MKTILEWKCKPKIYFINSMKIKFQFSCVANIKYWEKNPKTQVILILPLN